MTTASVELWGRRIGAVTWVADREVGIFQYTPEFVGSGIEVSPLRMPLRETPYEFAGLSRETFKGLPGMLADSLPDKFGNALINAWLTSQGRSEASFNPVERLCYTGLRGMGALEYKPAISGPHTRTRQVEISRLVALANRVLRERANLTEDMSDAGQHAGDRKHLARRHIRWRCKGKGHCRVEWKDRQLPVGSDQGWRRVYLLAPQVRRRGRQQGQGACRPTRVRTHRIRISSHGEESRNHHDAVPAP